MFESSAVRPGDQPLYVSDTSKLTADTGWSARHSKQDILEAIFRFWQANRELLSGQRGASADSLPPAERSVPAFETDLVSQGAA